MSHPSPPHSHLGQSHYSLRFVQPKDHLHLFPPPPPPSPPSPSLVSSSSSQPHVSYLLLELPPDLLTPVKNHLLDQSQDAPDPLSFQLRGRLDDELVLTTSEKTYSLRTIQNSNSVMVCTTAPDPLTGLPSLQVLKTVNETIEFFDVTALPGNRLERVKELLQNSIYRGEEEEDQPGRAAAQAVSEPVTFDRLASETRASDSEIRSYLGHLNVVQHQNGLRMISTGYLTEILSDALAAIIDLGFKPDEPVDIGPLVDIVTARKNIHPSVFSQIIRWYFPPRLDAVDHDQAITLDVERMATTIGLASLLSIKPSKVEPMNARCTKFVQSVAIDKFLLEWKTRLGSNYGDQYCSISNLQSHSILSSDQKHLIVVPVDKLSPEPKTRMSQLFQIRSKWKMDELERFVRPITGGGVKKKMDELVLKFCRKIKEKETVRVLNGSVEKVEVVEVVWLTARNNW